MKVDLHHYQTRLRRKAHVLVQNRQLHCSNLQPTHYPKFERLLVVQNEYFTASAVFTKQHGYPWYCSDCAPILSWMRKIPLDTIPTQLLKRGCKWKWNPISQPSIANRLNSWPQANMPHDSVVKRRDESKQTCDKQTQNDQSDAVLSVGVT